MIVQQWMVDWPAPNGYHDVDRSYTSSTARRGRKSDKSIKADDRLEFTFDSSLDE